MLVRVQSPEPKLDPDFTNFSICGIVCFMIEPVFARGTEATYRDLLGRPDAKAVARDRALLWRATNLAIESAFSYGIDLPVGAVVASGNLIVGRWFARDRYNGFAQAHAEFMAIQDWQMTRRTSGAPEPDTLVVSIEPCDRCQDFIATIPSIKRVGFGLPRTAVSDRGIVRPHEETVFVRALRKGLPYEVMQIDDDQLQHTGLVLLDHVQRDPSTQEVAVDQSGLHDALVALNN